MSKALYRLEKPERWSVIVFVYPFPFPYCPWCKSPQNQEFVWHSLQDRCPTCRKRGTIPMQRHFIKRLVGLPGETLWIQDGDVYIDGKIAPKPKELQKHLWQRVCDDELLMMEGLAARERIDWDITLARSEYCAVREKLGKLPCKEQDVLLSSVQEGGLGTLSPAWQRESGTWDFADGAIAARAADGQTGFLSYAREIKDSYADDQENGRARSGRSIVGDLRLRFGVTVKDDKGGITGAILNRHGIFEFRMAGRQGPCVVTLNGTAIARASNVALAPGREHTVDFWIWDGQGLLTLDDAQLLEFAEPVTAPPVTPTTSSGVRIGVWSCNAVFRDVTIERDIYYCGNYMAAMAIPRYGVDEPLHIPEGNYFVLGDNSPSSKDGRMWDWPPFVPAGNIAGKALVKFFPPGRIGPIH